MTKPEITRLLNQAARQYDEAKELHDRHDYEQAVEVLQDMLLKVHEPILGKYHKSTIKTYWRLGRSQHSAGHEAAALVSFKRAMRTCEASYGKDHASTRMLVEDIQTILAAEDETTSSVQSGTPSVKTIKPDYMQAIEDWLDCEREGDYFTKRHNYSRAIQKYREALDMEERVFGAAQNNNMDRADITVKLACVYRMQGDLAHAEELYQEALATFQATIGEDHPATLGASSHLRKVHELSSKNQGAPAKNWLLGGAGRTSSFRTNRTDQ